MQGSVEAALHRHPGAGLQTVPGRPAAGLPVCQTGPQGVLSAPPPPPRPPVILSSRRDLTCRDLTPLATPPICGDTLPRCGGGFFYRRCFRFTNRSRGDRIGRVVIDFSRAPPHWRCLGGRIQAPKPTYPQLKSKFSFFSDLRHLIWKKLESAKFLMCQARTLECPNF